MLTASSTPQATSTIRQVKGEDTVSQQVEQFHQLVLQNHSLKARLKTAVDFTSFIHMTVKLGEEHGYNFTPKEVERYVNQNMLTLMRQFS